MFEIEVDREADGRWIAEVLEVPGALAYGRSPEEARQRALAIAVRVTAAEVWNTETPADAEVEVVARAAMRAAELLDIDPAVLAATLGLSGAGAARLLDGRLDLAPGGEPFDRAALFLRLFVALDHLVGGDQAAARSWLRAFNVALRGEPLALMQVGQGLARVAQYLEASLAR